nr:GIY-YIG nuclease family protein [Gelidibacter pelagius]
MKDLANGYYKIGISNNPTYREKTLQSEKPTIELIKSKLFSNRKVAVAFERSLHKTYENKRLRGEWFELSERDIKEIKEIMG